MKVEDAESEFTNALKILVNSSLWRVNKIALTAVGDIFNAIGERLEKWQQIKDRGQLILLLKAGAILVTKTTIESTNRVESVKVSVCVYLFMLCNV